MCAGRALEPKMAFRVHTLSGELVGSYTLNEPDDVLWKLLCMAENVTASITSFASWEDSTIAGVSVVAV